MTIDMQFFKIASAFSKALSLPPFWVSPIVHLQHGFLALAQTNVFLPHQVMLLYHVFNHMQTSFLLTRNILSAVGLQGPMPNCHHHIKAFPTLPKLNLNLGPWASCMYHFQAIMWLLVYLASSKIVMKAFMTYIF